MIEENYILDNDTNNIKSIRRNLLPLWVKIFAWIFTISGALIIPLATLGVFGIISHVDISLYGLNASIPFSVVWNIVLLLFIIKGIVGFGLLTCKYWAINLAIIDAVIGIATCIILIILPFLDNSSVNNIDIRLEILLLIPYLIKMIGIRKSWQQSVSLP